MKINKLSLVGYVFGILVIILSIWRWWFVFYDVSTMVAYVVGGCFVICFAYVYNVLKIKEEEYEGLVRMVDSFLAWKLEMEEKGYGISTRNRK